ncbi:hypothetical protein ACFFRR_003126 [Megaselia abdita]
MFSFFSSKNKKSSPTEDVQSTGSPDDYIFVEKRSPADPPASTNVYPSVPQPVYPPAYPMRPGFERASSVDSSNQHCLEGVPFKLSPQLSAKDSYDIVQLQVDGILAALTKQMQMDGDYTFKLEKEILNYDI